MVNASLCLGILIIFKLQFIQGGDIIDLHDLLPADSDLLAASLPLFNESFSFTKTLGVALVMLGVITINTRPARAPEFRSAP